MLVLLVVHTFAHIQTLSGLGQTLEFSESDTDFTVLNTGDLIFFSPSTLAILLLRLNYFFCW